MTLSGYDIAGVNGSGIITTALKGEFTICKATEGLTFNDSLHDTFCSKLRAAGKLVGHYHYAHPNHSAVEEADHFVTRANPRTGEVMALDFEPYSLVKNSDGTTKTSAQIAAIAAGWPEWIIAFCARVQAKTGASCWVYLNDWFIGKVLTAATTAQVAALRTIPLWKAGRNNAYVSSPSVGPGDTHGWSALTCWQWKGTTIDEDVFYGDASAWKALAVGAPTLPEDDMTPEEVTKAVWGSDTKALSEDGTPETFLQAFAREFRNQRWQNDQIRSLQATVGALQAAVTALAAGDVDLTAEQIQAAAQAGAQAAIDAEIDSATVNLNVTPGA